MSETLELGEQWSLTMERGSHSVGMPDGYLATFPTGPFRHTLELQTAGNEEAIAAIKAGGARALPLRPAARRVRAAQVLLTGLPIFAIRGHDVEEFVGVVERYGAGAAAGATAALVAAARKNPTLTAADVSSLCGTCVRMAA